MMQTPRLKCFGGPVVLDRRACARCASDKAKAATRGIWVNSTHPARAEGTAEVPLIPDGAANGRSGPKAGMRPTVEVGLASKLENLNLFCRQADAREIRPRDSVSSKSTVLSGLAVILLCQGSARNLPDPVPLCTNHWDQVSEHQMLRACALRHCTKVCGRALTMKE